jgi:YegS/Rv2252/BmrU family lipid kinase
VSAATAARSAVLVNPTKVTDEAALRADICAGLAEGGWPEPVLWLTTTEQDTGYGQGRQAVDAGVDVLFVYGGDGTIRAAVCALAGTPVALAVLPGGTGNLLAANLKVPNRLDLAVAAVTDGARRRIDVGVAGTERFAVMAGMGFDAHLVDAPEGSKAKLGTVAYVLTALRHLRDRPMRLRLRLDGGRFIRRRAQAVLVGNVGTISGGIPLLPDALPDDGLFDVALLAPGGILDWLKMAGGVLLRRPEVTHLETFRARRVEIRSDRDQPRELDGDVISPGRELNVTMEPLALTVCVPI